MGPVASHTSICSLNPACFSAHFLPSHPPVCSDPCTAVRAQLEKSFCWMIRFAQGPGWQVCNMCSTLCSGNTECRSRVAWVMKHECDDTNCLLFSRAEFTPFPLSALLQEIKALVVAHNIPSRLFASWDVAVVTSPATHPEDSTQSQSIEEVVAECLTLLVNVADYVLKSAEVKFSFPPPALHSPTPFSSRRVHQHAQRILEAAWKHHRKSLLYSALLLRPVSACFVWLFE